MNSARQAGVVMPVFSLPSPHGIGTFGAAAHKFAEFLAEAGQSVWQMLPLGPTGFGDSPYQSFSSFAGNPYFIDLDLLADEGLLLPSEIAKADAAGEYIDYEHLYRSRLPLLRLAWERSEPDGEPLTDELRDYAMFMALKQRFDMRPWYEWPEDIRRREPEAMEHYSRELSREIDFQCFLQRQFQKQYSALRQHCRKLGLRLMGDLPMYVAPDSADVWASPEQFQLDEQFRPLAVAGVPPDYFSETGQLWGNPLYRWDEMEKDGFAWWKKRIAASAELFDLIRIDHFRALEAYWSVPPDAETAAGGQWRSGPGAAFADMLTASFPDTEFVAEDLGLITPTVHELRRRAGLPGMAVLSFAFDPGCESSYLPHNIERNCVCYTGTHDNETLAALISAMPERQLEFLSAYCGGARPRDVIRAGMASPAALFIAQMQDWLELGAEARVNTPGSKDGSWRWRLPPGLLTHKLAAEMRGMTTTFFRRPNAGSEEEIIYVD